MRTRAFSLFVTLVAAVALVSVTGAATAKVATAELHSQATIDVSTRASVVRYLRSIDVNPSGVVIERGARNYAGANCPGAGWSCTTTTHPVVQVASAGGRNTFLCSTARCAVVQVAARMTTATNLARCIQTSGPQSCTIHQASATANNKAVVYQRAVNSTGSVVLLPGSKAVITQVATSTVLITQKATGPAGAPNSNTACVFQSIAFTRSGTFPRDSVTHTQSARARVTIKQDSKYGGNSAAESATSGGGCTGGSIKQRETLSSNLNVPASVTQAQNAGDLNFMTIDIEQNKSTGFFGGAQGENVANFDQFASLTAIAKSTNGPVIQTQGSISKNDLLGTVNQDSRDESTAVATQTEEQCQSAATTPQLTCETDAHPQPDSVTQLQSMRVHKGVGTATQTGNAADTFIVNQSATQSNDTGEGQTNEIQGDCSTEGLYCTVTQDTDINGTTQTNTKSGQNVNTSTSCSGSDCASTSELWKEQFETGAPGWAMVGPTGAQGPRWHIQDQPQNISVVNGINPQLVTLPDAGSLPAAFGGTHDAWFGDPATGTYCGTDWNNVSQGSKDGCTSSERYQSDLTSPSFDLSTATSAIVTFESWYEIEALFPSIDDQLSVLYSTNGGSTWTPAALLNPADDPGDTDDQSYSNNGLERSPTWQKFTVDLSAAAGSANVMVRFDFDTGDELWNGFRGWAVDDVAVWIG